VECVKLARRERASLAHAVGGACIIAANYGEFGGWIALHGVGPPTLLARELPRQIVLVGDRRWLLTGLSHLGVTSGRVYVLAAGPSGRWNIEPVARLPGSPVAWGVNSSNDLLLLTEDQPLPVPGSCPAKYLLVRVGPNGDVEALE
jgi:hypothetical protein